MHAAAFPLVMNIAVAGLFAASYVTIALANPGYRAPVWFAAAYGVGMLTPFGQLGLAYSRFTLLFGGVIYFSFAAALLLMVPSLAIFYRRRPPWRVVAAAAAVTVVTALLLLQLSRATLIYHLAYQVPFTLATAACVWVVLRDSPRRAGDLVLAGMFALLALHFPVKSVFAYWLGTGRTPANYIESTYALVSQVSSGILLVATGLVVLLKAVQEIIRESRTAAETDPLSGLVNRRGFGLRAARILSRARQDGTPVALLLLDLDHFKVINDTLGHSAGDRAIRAFADMLMHAVPEPALVGRCGGEEFAVLLDISGEAARLRAEDIRRATMTHAQDGVPAVTVSIGVAALGPLYGLEDAFERADVALYAAKAAGRNRVCVAEDVRLSGSGEEGGSPLRLTGSAASPRTPRAG